MSKRSYIYRYSIILSQLRKNPFSTYLELETIILNKLEFIQEKDSQLNMGFSKSTFERDIREIRSLFGIDIEYSRRHKGYIINDSEFDGQDFGRLIESFDIFNSLQLSKEIGPFIYLENRKPQGTDHLYGFLHAIKNSFIVQFSYKKFWEKEASIRIAEPYALKEFKNRWYLLAKDKKDNKIKTFALDRIYNLEIINKIFEVINRFDIEKSFENSFGIINPENQLPQEIILSFDPIQGKYIQSLPIHDSQKIILTNDQELRISLNLLITHDLIMELMSYGEDVKVLAPPALVYDIREAHKKAYAQY